MNKYEKRQSLKEELEQQKQVNEGMRNQYNAELKKLNDQIAAKKERLNFRFNFLIQSQKSWWSVFVPTSYIIRRLKKAENAFADALLDE